MQADAVHELPHGVAADVRPVCAGLRRALQGLRTPGPTDIVHGLDVDLPWRTGGARTVATIHDASVVDVPWAFPSNRARAERLLLGRTARTADEIIVPSAFTADRVLSLYGRTAHVTHLAGASWATPPSAEDVSRVRAAYNLPDEFVLQVGTAEPRKLTALLIASARQASVPLVFAGLGSEHLTGQGVRGLGHIPAGDLPALYGTATVVSYLSTYEGFGLPPLEAMACGAAVLASDIEPLREVLGEAARLVVNRLDAVSSALTDLVADEDQVRELRDRGRQRAAQFSWQATARATTTVYRMV